jgi:multisubunit Na+/H+ antiporter MnhF subunit
VSDEGVRLVSRLALVVVLILVAAAFRTMVGPSKRRGRVVAMGTIGGIAFGIVVAYPISRWFGADVSAIAACMGIIVGWAISWQYARKIPREAL